MPHSNQAKKRLRQDERRRLHNRALSSRMKTEIKKVMTAVESKDLEGAEAALPEAMKRIDKAAKRRVIHPNNADRKKSRLARTIQQARTTD